MPAQDDARENRIVDLFNLQRPPNRVRHGTDAILAIDGKTIEFELKSVTTSNGSISTVRDFGPAHISKWKDKHWLIAVYRNEALIHCKYGSPAAMAPWIEKMWSYIEADFRLAQLVPEMLDINVMVTLLGQKTVYLKEDAKRLHKAQYSARRYRELMDIEETSANGRTKALGYSPGRMVEILRDRVKYVIERGSTLNNPHVPASYFAEWEVITQDHASRVRQLVRDWLTANQPQATVPLPAQHDIP